MMLENFPLSCTLSKLARSEPTFIFTVFGLLYSSLMKLKVISGYKKVISNLNSER